MFMQFSHAVWELMSSEVSLLNNITLGGTGLVPAGFFTIMIAFVLFRLVIKNIA